MASALKLIRPPAGTILPVAVSDLTWNAIERAKMAKSIKDARKNPNICHDTGVARNGFPEMSALLF
ncbi:hypothetical protein [Sphingobium scionense]|uniref:hypothetical protein n=1 Tax=Sphingobium scionense TaxID=1404341 RepID=UPI00361D95E4